MATGFLPVALVPISAFHPVTPDVGPGFFKATSSQPTVPVITSPSDYSSVGLTETFTGTAQPGVTVELYRDGVSVGTAVSDAGGAWSLPNVPTE